MSRKGCNNVPSINATFTDPDAVRLEQPDGTWILLGTENAGAEAVESLLATRDGAAFCRSHRDALIMFIRHSETAAQRFDAWKGLLSTRELFFAVRPAGDVVVSDHFVNVLSALPPGARLPDERGIVGHFIHRKVYGSATYSAAVTRLSNAEHLSIDALTRETASTLFDRVEVEPEPRSPEEYVSAIDTTFAQSMAYAKSGTPAALTFSGGVDSTLLMTYVRDTATPLTFVPDTPEFGSETEYSRDALRLLGIRAEEVATPEANFVAMLEASTDACGFPTSSDAIPYFTDLTLTQPYDTFIVGHGADSAFGMSLKLARFASWFRGRGVRGAVAKTAPHVPGHLGYRMRQVAPMATGFAKDPLDPDGYAGNIRTFGDTSLFEKLVDPSLITAVKKDQLEYVLRRVDRTADPNSAFLSHIELAHWAMVFVNPLLLERLAAHSVGRRIIGPYSDAATILELARVPVDERYVRGLRAKWILKDLLKKRLPDYPSDQRKKATALPFERFYRDGPLAGIWDQYEVPDIFTGKDRDAVVAEPSTSTWNAITYAVWKKRIADNPTLRPHPSKFDVSFKIGAV